MFSKSSIRCWRKLASEKTWRNASPWFSISGCWRALEPSFLFVMYFYLRVLIGYLVSGYQNVRSNWWKWTKTQLVVTCVGKQIFKTTLSATEKFTSLRENVKVVLSIRLNYLTYSCWRFLAETCSRFRVLEGVLFGGEFHFRNILIDVLGKIAFRFLRHHGENVSSVSSPLP